MESKKSAMTAIYTFAHFAVDFSCAYLVFNIYDNFYDAALLMLIYNFCAFALQMPLGIIFDKLNRNFLGAAAGCLLTALAYLFGNIPLAAVIICGVGNAFFHLGGGIDVLNYSEKTAPSGVFVSSGAIGLFLGTLAAKGGLDINIGVISVLTAVAIFIVLMQKRLFQKFHSDNEPFALSKIPPTVILGAILLFAVVCLRSFTGFGAVFSWKTGVGAFLAVIAAAGGKLCGGFAADRLGMKKASVISLALAALLFLFGENIIAGLIALLLFNITMPITLRQAADVFTGCKGFSFGLMTFGLFCGFIPIYLHKTALVLSPVTLCILSAISLIILVTALILCKGKGERK